MVQSKSFITLQVLKWLWWILALLVAFSTKTLMFFCLYIMRKDFALREMKLQFLALRKKAVCKWA